MALHQLLKNVEKIFITLVTTKERLLNRYEELIG